MLENNLPVVHLISDEEVKNAKVKNLFEQMKNSGGAVPKWMRVMANCEDTLLGFFSLFKSVMDNTPTDRTLKWKVAYIVSTMNECAFCVNVSALKLKEFGLSENDLKNIEQNLSAEEKIAVQFSKETTACAYKINPETISGLKEKFTDEQIVEITAVVGLFSFINRFNDALGILPDIQ